MSNSLTALVTGGSRGIGREIAKSLAAAGWIVTVNYRSNREAAEQALAEMPGKGHRAVPADVSTSQGRQDLVEQVGAPDLLVNNAGITRDNLFIRMSQEEWDEVLETNFLAVMDLTEAMLPGMRERGSGKIVNISSTVGVHGNAGQANYATAKAGLIRYSRLLARELMPQIQVNAIAPGLVETDMTSGLGLDKLADTLLGRAAKPSEIAAMVRLLASSEGDYITGQVLEIDGGLFLRGSVEELHGASKSATKV